MKKREKRRALLFAAMVWLMLLPVGAQGCGEHIFVSDEVVATCTQPGYTYQLCTQCGLTVDYSGTQPLGHSMGQWMVDQEATCEAAGIESSTCQRCGEKQEREIPQLEHTYSETKHLPSCTKDGYTLQTCSVCSHEEKSNIVPALGHDNSEQTVDPTCTKKGYTLLLCSVCSHEEKTNQVEELGHDYVSERTEPTCTADGYTRHVCSRCQDSYRTDQTDKLGHEYDDGVLTKEPTLTTMGRITYTCVRCEDSYKETTPKWTNPFEDLDKKGFYFDGVLWAYNNGITTGATETSFDPNGNCTRAQVVTFLWRQAGMPLAEGEGMNFADVAETAYYRDAVHWAVEQGITNGVSESLFAPNRVCTRGEVVTFLHRAKGLPVPVGRKVFADVPATAYYSQAVSWAFEAGITQGTSANGFSPGLPCTRGQIVTFLYRARML